MAKAINHTVSSSVATTGWEAVKGGAVGAVATVALGALFMGGLATLGVGAVALVGLATGSAALAGAFSSVAGLIAIGVASLVGAVGGASVIPAGAIAGGAAGAFHGVRKVSKESHAYEQRASLRAHGHEAELNMVAQQAYMAGAQAGAAHVVGQIQQMQAQAAQEQAAAPVGKFTANCKTKCDSKVEALVQERASQTGKQLGV